MHVALDLDAAFVRLRNIPRQPDSDACYRARLRFLFNWVLPGNNPPVSTNGKKSVPARSATIRREPQPSKQPG